MTRPALYPLRSGTVLNVAGRVGTLALGLAVLVVVARQGPQVQGALALFMAVEALLVALGSGLGLALAREVHDGRVRAAALHAGLLWALVAGLMAGLVLALASRLSEQPPYAQLWMLALAAPFVLLAPTVLGLWMGQGRLRALNLAQAAAPATMLVALVLLLGAGGGELLSIAAVLATWAASRAVVGLASAGAALHAVGDAASARVLQPASWSPDFRFLSHVALSNVLSLLNLRLTLFLVERHAGLAEAGVYAAAVQVAELLWVLSAAVSTTAYAGLRDEPAAAARLALRALRLAWGLTLAAVPLLALLGWWALPALLGPAYEQARGPLLLLLPGVWVYAAASVLSAYHTHGLGRPLWSAQVAAGSLALTLLIALWAVPRWGAPGAALATSTAFVVALALALHGFLRAQGWGWGVLLRAPRAGGQSVP